ncbi:MAG: hypothetical protein IJ185_04550 [Prevotella sp.]|nr:hypothetical protein [Prevotella sp.]
MKKFNYLFSAAAIAAAMLMTSCNKEDNPVTPAQPQYQALFTYDFTAAEAAGENPDNFNGNQNNGQGFYGWEKADKTDSKRNDYKGYTWAEGSVLPEECHVWRRSDRINSNVKNGGLYCPNNREMAVDGLEVGYVVEITYDNAEASDGSKDIIWAIGDGTSEGGPGSARATATIDGVEAVTGVTPIASGAKIEVKSVTPADKGTGYIVFQVKKNMVIKKIVISKKL